MDWFKLSLIALVTIAISNFLFVVATKQGVTADAFVFVVTLANAVYFGTKLYCSGTSIIPLTSAYATILCVIAIAAILSVLGNYFQFSALRIAPNAGFALAIVGLQSLLVAIAGRFVFKQAISPLQGLALVLGLISVILFNIGNTQSDNNISEISQEG